MLIVVVTVAVVVLVLLLFVVVVPVECVVMRAVVLFGILLFSFCFLFVVFFSSCCVGLLRTMVGTRLSSLMWSMLIV